MEFRFVDIPFGKLVCRSHAEAAAEGELPLPEGRRAENIEVVASQSSLSPVRAYIAKGEAVVEGRVRTTLLCLDRSTALNAVAQAGEDGGTSNSAQGNTPDVFSFSATAPFRYTSPVTGGNDRMTVEAACELQQASVSVSSALSYRASVAIDLTVTEKPCGRALSGVVSGKAEFLTRKLVSATAFECGSGEARISQSFACPQAQAALFPLAAVEVKSVNTGGGTALVDMLVHTSFVALTGAGELETERFSFPQTVEFHLEREPIGRTSAAVEVESAYARVNADGMATVELVLSARIFSEREESAAVPIDAYMPDANLIAKRERATLVCCAPTVCRRVDSRERVAIPQSLPPILRAVAANGVAFTTSVSSYEGKLRIEGIIALNIVYQSDAGTVSFEKQTPFLSDVDSDMETALVSSRVLSLAASAAGNSVDVLSSLELTVTPYCDAELETVTGMEKLDAQKRPRALTVCFTGESDSAFAIGKRYMIHSDAIADISKENAKDGHVVMFLA